ncbi:hypothetical protein [Paenibacillus mesophilus]|uniref:hypothetical protein n=1 Tax=Paenibacillus mesophilus TaxID=2582849 RepID=UPI0013052AFC|nr:hypothetical protein [Paenibacillus mesophilus]
MQLMNRDGREQEVRAAVDAVMRFRYPRELHPDARRKSEELYSLDEADCDRLLRSL